MALFLCEYMREELGNRLCDTEILCFVTNGCTSLHHRLSKQSSTIPCYHMFLYCTLIFAKPNKIHCHYSIKTSKVVRGPRPSPGPFSDQHLDMRTMDSIVLSVENGVHMALSGPHPLLIWSFLTSQPLRIPEGFDENGEGFPLLE